MSDMDREYYRRGGIEAIDVIDAWGLGYELGNVIKYVARAGYKGTLRLEDLRKARWYLDREIARSIDPVAEVERMRGTVVSQTPDCLSPNRGFWRPDGMEGGSFMSAAPNVNAQLQPATTPHAQRQDNTCGNG
jgi:hypothetical protein